VLSYRLIPATVRTTN